MFHFSRFDFLNAFLGLFKLWGSMMRSWLYERALGNKKLKWVLVLGVIGLKDLPIIARTTGRLAGQATGYVQLARGQFENVMQQSQARQVISFNSSSCF